MTASITGSVPESVPHVSSLSSTSSPARNYILKPPASNDSDSKILPPLSYGSPGVVSQSHSDSRHATQPTKTSPYDTSVGIGAHNVPGNSPGVSPESTRSSNHAGSHASVGSTGHKSVQLAPLKDTRLVAIPIGSSSVLRINPDDAMDVFSNASFSLMVEGPIWAQQGPLSYIGLTKSDPFMKLIRHYTITIFMSGEMSQFIHNERIKRREIANKRHKRASVSASASALLKTESNPSKDTSEDASPASHIGDDDVQDTDALIVTKIGNQVDHENSVTPPLILGLHRLTALKREYYKIVEQAAIDILPAKHIAAMLFFHFVKYVQPFIPIVSESTILLDVRPVMPGFPEFKDEKFQALSIKSDHSLHVLGIFLLILRLGYMSLVHTNEVQYTKDELTMISYMRSILNQRYMAVVGTCLPDGLTTMSLSKCSIKELQCLTLLHFYRQVAPDDGHGLGGADSQVLLGTIIRQALSIGLNRDPSKYEAHENIRKQTGLVSDWRHLWSYLCDVDAVLSMNCGSIPNLPSLEFSDVKAPDYENRLGQAEPIFRNIKAINAIYRRICNMITDVQKLPKIVDLLLEANELEKVFLDFFGKDFFNEYICNPDATKTSLSNGIGSTEYELLYLKVIKFNTFIQVRNNLSCLYYKVAIHYELQYDKMGTPSMMAAIELFKIFVKSVVQLVYIMSFTLDHLVELFGRCFDFILTANNERCMIKTHNFLSSFFIRLIHHKKVLDDRCKAAKESGIPDEATMERAQVIDSLFQMIIVEAELFVGNFRKLSRTYINSYRLYVMTYLVLKQCMEDVEAFFAKTGEDSYHSGTNMLEFFTIDELRHLQKLCEEFRFAKHKNEERQKKRKLDPTNHGGYFTMDSMPLGENSTNISSSPEDPFMNMNMEDMGADLMTNDDIVRLFDMYGDVERPAWNDI